jgi:hypothetical protein
MKLQALFAIGAVVLSACAVSSEPVGTDNGAGEAAKKTCVDTVMCVQGYVWSPRSCSCVPAKNTCGNKVCGKHEYCCSSSCGICATIGSMCPAIACAQ